MTEQIDDFVCQAQIGHFTARSYWDKLKRLSFITGRTEDFFCRVQIGHFTAISH